MPSPMNCFGYRRLSEEDLCQLVKAMKRGRKIIRMGVMRPDARMARIGSQSSKNKIKKLRR